METNGLTEFLSVARTGNFTRAAAVLGQSVAHVSRQVARLEKRLGTRLFERSTRSVQLTPAGESFRTRIQQIEDQLEDALLSASNASRSISGKVRIASLSGSFADQVVTPALLDLAEQYPELELEIDYETRNVDIIREGYDLAIRSGPLRESALVALPVARRRFVAAAAPSYLEEFGTPAHPNDLINHMCIRVRGETWEFSEAGKPLLVPIRSRLKINVTPAITDACHRGFGIAYIASTGFGDLLRNREVVPVLQPFWRSEMSIFAVRPHRSFVPARVRLVMECLAQAGSEFEKQDQGLSLHNRPNPTSEKRLAD